MKRGRVKWKPIMVRYCGVFEHADGRREFFSMETTRKKAARWKHNCDLNNFPGEFVVYRIIETWTKTKERKS